MNYLVSLHKNTKQMRIRVIIMLLIAALSPVLVQAQDVAESDTVATDSTDVVLTSTLAFPKAFSPNGDQINDVFKAKECQNIVEFHAYIFNRWGQRLYEWSDPEGGWDGTYNGKDVKQGTYFVLVKAKGADGHKFNIRKDVNLLRGYTEGNTTNTQ